MAKHKLALGLSLIMSLTIAVCAAQEVASAPHASASSVVIQQSVSPINNLDLDRYMGRWYQVAHLPGVNDSQCQSPITLDYTHVGDKLIIKQSCSGSSNDKQLLVSEVYLRPSNYQGDGRLFIASSPRWLRWLYLHPREVWVVYTDYLYAVIANPELTQVWVYSRQEAPDNMELAHVIANLAGLQAISDKLIYDATPIND
jgi:apolipoprotein D and lipocalin family protein